MILRRIVSLTPSPGAAGALEVVLYALSAIWLLATLGAAGWYWWTTNLPEGELLLLEIGAVLVGAAGVTLFGAWGELYGQQARDLRARAIYAALQRGETPPPYAVYLRPFASTGEISEISVSAPTVGAAGVALAGVETELEAQIERAVRPVGLLVGLGRPLEHIGAGRISVAEHEWRDAVKLLLQRARLIIMLPSPRGGTLEEIALLIDSGMIERTVLLDAPNIRRSKKFDHAADWSAVRDAFAERGFSLPADTRTGLLVFFGDKQEPKFKERLDIDAEDRIERLFKRVIRFTTSAAVAATPSKHGSPA